jgi:hypothetical protein
METARGTWKLEGRANTITALSLCLLVSACADTGSPPVAPCHHAALVASGGTPPLVTYARESLSVLDELETINARLRPRGGALDALATTIRGWMGNADMERIAMLAVGRNALASCNDKDLFYIEMAKGTAAVPWVPFATNRAFLTAARRDAHDIIDRHDFRGKWLANHGDMLGADAAYVAPSHMSPKRLPQGWSVTEIK